MSFRRASDRWQHRLCIGLAVLACTLCVLSCVLSVRALNALKAFERAMKSIERMHDDGPPSWLKRTNG